MQNRSETALHQFQKIRNALQDDQDTPRLAIDAAIGAAITHQLREEYTKAIEVLLAILKNAPDNQSARFVLGNIYLSQKSFTDAVGQFRQLQDSVLESQVEELDLRTYYGAQSAVSATYYNLGVRCVSKRWLTFAKDAFKTALWRTPDNPLLHYALGNVYFLTDAYENTVKSFEKTLEYGSKFISVHKRLGDMHQKQQHFERAIRQYQTYLQHHPNDDGIRVLLGMAYEKDGQLESAIAEYQHAIEMDTANPLAFNQLAWVYAEQETQLDDALKFAQKALSLSPTAGVLDTLGWVYYKRQEYSNALEQFRRALDMTPFHPMITYHLGLAHYQQGEHERAKQLFEQVLESSENFEHAEEIRKIIEEL
jgi:tetratricopeptide (TPR) repeat protein